MSLKYMDLLRFENLLSLSLLVWNNYIIIDHIWWLWVWLWRLCGIPTCPCCILGPLCPAYKQQWIMALIYWVSFTLKTRYVLINILVFTLAWTSKWPLHLHEIGHKNFSDDNFQMLLHHIINLKKIHLVLLKLKYVFLNLAAVTHLTTELGDDKYVTSDITAYV